MAAIYQKTKPKTFTFELDPYLHEAAMREAKKLDIPLSVIMRALLEDFVNSSK